METTQPETQVQPSETQSEQTEDWKRFTLDILETIILAVVLYFGINAMSARVPRGWIQHGPYPAGW